MGTGRQKERSWKSYKKVAEHTWDSHVSCVEALHTGNNRRAVARDSGIVRQPWEDRDRIKERLFCIIRKSTTLSFAMTIEKHILPSLFALLALGSGTAVAQSETVFYGQLKIGIVKATINFGREMGKK